MRFPTLDERPRWLLPLLAFILLVLCLVIPIDVADGRTLPANASTSCYGALSDTPQSATSAHVVDSTRNPHKE